MQKVKSAWFTFMAFLARHRAVAVSIVGILAPAFLALFLEAWTNPTSGELLKLWLGLYVPTQLLLVLASLAPIRYAHVALLESMLPSIHAVLKLKETDRVTIHHLRSIKQQTYEQLTNYHPTNIGRGRVFHFTHGIVGKSFMTRREQAYSIPQGKDFVQAMKDDWAFTDDELGRLTKDRQSLFAFPIGYERQHAKAVLFMDSKDPNTFTSGNMQTIAKNIEELFLSQINQLIPSASAKVSL